MNNPVPLHYGRPAAHFSGRARFASALLFALVAASAVPGAEKAEEKAPRKPKIDVDWVLELSSHPEVQQSTLNDYIDNDQLAPHDIETNKKLVSIVLQSLPSRPQDSDSDVVKTQYQEATRKAAERTQKLFLMRQQQAAAIAASAAKATPGKRDIHTEPRDKFELRRDPSSGSEITVGKPGEPDYDWKRVASDRDEPYRDSKTGEPINLAAWEKDYAQRHRAAFSARLGYEVLHFPDQNGKNDEGGPFMGIRYYSENVARWDWFSTMFASDEPGPGAISGEVASKYERANRIGELDFFADVNYRTADAAGGNSTLESVESVNFAVGAYTPLSTNFPRAVLFDFSDDGYARGEFGLIAAAGIKAVIDRSPDSAEPHDYQKFGGAGFRMATFRPDAPDPIRYMDVLLGGRSDLNNPRFRIESHYLLYELGAGDQRFDESNKTNKNAISPVGVYAFGAVEVDLKKDGTQAEDSLIIGAYVRYELDRIKSVFGSILP